MMLRASSELNSETVDLAAVTGGGGPAHSVGSQRALLALVEAALAPEPDDLPGARSLVEAELGPAALVDAAAVIGNFERMTRIADGTGIPLDPPVAAMTADLRDELGINAFGSAGYTPPVGFFRRRLFRLLQALMIRRIGRQLSAD